LLFYENKIFRLLFIMKMIIAVWLQYFLYYNITKNLFNWYLIMSNIHWELFDFRNSRLSKSIRDWLVVIKCLIPNVFQYDWNSTPLKRFALLVVIVLGNPKRAINSDSFVMTIYCHRIYCEYILVIVKPLNRCIDNN